MELKEHQSISSPEFKSQKEIKEWLHGNEQVIKKALNGSMSRVGHPSIHPDLTSSVEVIRQSHSGSGDALKFILDLHPQEEGQGRMKWEVKHHPNRIEDLTADRDDSGWQMLANGYFEQITINPDGQGLELTRSDDAADTAYHIAPSGVVTMTLTPKTTSQDLRT